MPRLQPLPLAIALLLPSLATAAEGPVWALCRAPDALTGFRPTEADSATSPRESSPTHILADRLDVSAQNVTVFSGNVELTRADQWLGSEQLRYEHDNERWQSPGQVRIEDRSLRAQAARAEGDGKAQTTTLHDVEYRLKREEAGNGRAQTVMQEGDNATLKSASYSTCPPGQRQWEFTASEIGINGATDTGTATNATLRIGGVPVLWLPFIAFPTSEERRTGLLTPTLGLDDRNGFDWKQPIYINIAPNMDATIAPRWMSERGLMMNAEFRYLTANSGGTVEGSYLPNDDLRDRDRGYFRWQHFSALTPQWYATADLHEISDERYFTDFGSGLDRVGIAYLASSAQLVGRGRFWGATLGVARWEQANPALTPGAEPFERLPSLQAYWQQPVGRWLEAGVRGEMVRFNHTDLPDGDRIDLQPWLRARFGGAAWYVTPELAYRDTRYRLDNQTVGDRSPSRGLPIGSLDAGMVFERSTNFGDSAFVQTLEPRLFYLRVPYRDQTTLPQFDTQTLSMSWPGLFRTNRFSGADRQSDANQLTVAMTSRLLESDSGRERISASLGRILYFDTPRTRPIEDLGNDAGSAYVAEVDWRVSDRWSLSAAQQWNPGLDSHDLGAVRSQWRFRERGVVNLSYRYRRDLIEQTDLSFAVPVSAQWRLVGRWAWSIRDQRTLEALAGAEWRDCCLAVRVVARDYIRDLNAERNRGIYVEIELNGLGSFGRDTARLLHDAILDYSP